MEYRVCEDCGQSKLLNIKYFNSGTNTRNGIKVFYWYKTCKVCSNKKAIAKNRAYKKRNRKKLSAAQKVYHQNNKENDALTKKAWYQNNKDTVNLRIKNYNNARRKADPIFRIKENISCIVRSCINKNRASIKKYLPFTLEELKSHIEAKFEPWMNWDNYGVYRLNSWDVNDTTTWTWQIDHIIPHSNFKYSSMEDDAFKQCWALSNLRPYSAKQNIIDGDRKHK